MGAPPADGRAIEPARTSRGERVLLLELLTGDRLDEDGSRTFPFLSGLAADLGVACRWMCFGWDRARADDRFSVRLDPGDVARVADAIRAHGATVVVASTEVGAELRRAIEAARPGVRLLCAGMPWPSREEVERTLGVELPGAVDRWTLPDAAEPRYGCELSNALAREIRPFVNVAAGPGCVYRRPIARDPEYAGLAAEGIDLGTACAFCVQDDTRYRFATPPVALAIRQIRAAARDLPEERRSRTHVVRGAPLFFRLRAFADALLAEPLPPSTFLFSVRVDEVLRMAQVLDEVLPRLARAGHAIHLASVGAENFADRENRRFNKGITTAQLEPFVALVRRWEREHPGAFSFFGQGGFGHITFTPWTTLDDLEENFAAADRMELEFGALFLGSRALLRARTPLALLAERDGLVAERFEDDAMARVVLAGCLKSADEREIPWRFAHPEVGAIYSTLLRAIPELAAGLGGDPSVAPARALAARIAARSRRGGLHNRDLALALLRGARTSPVPRSPEELRLRVLDALREPALGESTDAGGVGRRPAPDGGARLLLDAGDACNNRCVFCSDGDGPRPGAVGDDGVLELLRAHAPADEVMFASGEPTLNPRLPAYVRYARDLGYRRIGVTTNGRRLAYESYARGLLEAGVNRVVVSIHGPDARTHDAQTRAPGSFVQTLAGLESLARLRGAHAFAVHTATVVGRPNAGRLRELYWLVRSTGVVDACVFHAMEPLGRAELLLRTAGLPYADVAREVGALAREIGDVRPRVVLASVPPCAARPLSPSGHRWVDPSAFAARARSSDAGPGAGEQGRVKRSECAACALDPACIGPWRTYVEVHGWAGLVPVAGGLAGGGGGAAST